jgi:hypothetical protein
VLTWPPTHLSRFRALACLCLMVGTALAVWQPVASAHYRPTPEHRLAAGPKAHVRWSGFHGVKFGEPLSAAAKKVHGRVMSDMPRSDARSVYYPGLVAIKGSLGADGYRSGGTVGSFQAFSERVIFPHHTFMGESLARFRRALGKGARPERPEHNAAIGYYLVGPHGRTLWAWGSGDTGVLAIGIAESLAGAEVDWVYEG